MGERKEKVPGEVGLVFTGYNPENLKKVFSQTPVMQKCIEHIYRSVIDMTGKWRVKFFLISLTI